VYFVAGGSTVNVCLLDLSKAFEKMDHRAIQVLKHIYQPVIAKLEPMVPVK